MSTKELVYRIGADYSQLDRSTDSAITKTRQWQREMAALEQKQREHRQTISDLGTGMVTFGGVIAAGLGLAAKAAIEWESAFAGVRKTVDGSDQEIAALEGELRQLARTLPTTHKEIAAVAEAAGQLGIKRADIAAFTKTMIDLGNTTNLTAEEAASELAKFANIMGTTASDVDRLGSALVALGNDGASTEKDILSMALRIAGAGKTIGISEAEVLGFASALSSVGIEAEAGGSSISRVMITMEQAVRSGGDQLEAFASVAGVSSAQFKKQYGQDAAGAIATFIAGLSRMQGEGKNVFAVLENLGFGEILVRDALLRTAGASDLLTKSLQVGTSAWAENNALTKEADKRYETSASKLQVAANQIKDAAIDIGATVGPMFVAAAEKISELVSWYQQLPGPLKEVVTYTALAAAGIGLVGGAALIAVPKVLAFRESMRSLDDAGGVMGKATSKFGLFMSGPWGAAIGVGVTLLGLFAAKSAGAAARQDDLQKAGRSVADAIREQNGAINANVKAAAAKAAEDTGLLSKARGLGLELGTVTDALLGQGTAYEEIKSQAAEAAKVATKYREDANAAAAGDFSRVVDREAAEAAWARSNALKALVTDIDAMRGANDSGTASAQRVDEASRGAANAARKQAEESERLAQEAKAATEALDGMITSLEKLNGIQLSYNEANRNYIEQLEATAKSLAENGQTLDINTEKGRANARALDEQATSAYELAEAAARQAEKIGGAAAGQGAFKASLDASRTALIETSIKFGLTRDEAIKYTNSVLGIPATAATQILTPGSQQAQEQLRLVMDRVLAIPPNKTVNVGALTEAAQQKLRDLGFAVTTLPNGTVNVAANTQKAKDDLNAFLAQPMTKVVQVQWRIPPGPGQLSNAYGNVVAFAAGGTWSETHTPQIANARPGTVRIWAEPETGRESYIPWARDRRGRATQILGMTADAFGYQLAPKSQPVSVVQAMGGGGGRTVDASFSVGTLMVGSYEEAIAMERRRRSEALFTHGLAST